MGDLLLDGDPEVVERRVAQSVQVEEKVVEVEPLGSVQGARAPRPLPEAGRHGGMALERLGVVLVLRAVVLPPVGADQRGIEMRDRVVRLLGLRGVSDRGALARRGRVELPSEVRVDRLPRVLELADRLARNILDDRLQAPARAPPGRHAVGRPVRHAGKAASSAL
jgi:hypothetical protein